MTLPFLGGAVLYAKNISSVAAFYAGVAGLRVVASEPGHIVLESAGFQLTIVATPPRIAASIHIASPPQRRENAALKLVLPVASLVTARAAALTLGGELNSADRERKFQNSRVCDGQDPEGNVIQFREVTL